MDSALSVHTRLITSIQAKANPTPKTNNNKKMCCLFTAFQVGKKGVGEVCSRKSLRK